MCKLKIYCSVSAISFSSREKEYETGLEDRLVDLHSRVHRVLRLMPIAMVTNPPLHLLKQQIQQKTE
jgi:hypothetical protein